MPKIYRRNFIKSSGIAALGLYFNGLPGTINTTDSNEKVTFINGKNRIKIESIEIYYVQMPLIQPFSTAYGSDNTIESIFVKMSSGNNYGWGESSPLKAPTYSPECASAV
jgi:hypothetical protein